MAKKNQKNLTQTEEPSQNAGAAAVSKKEAYYQNGEAMKAKSPAFSRYIGVMQKVYAGIPFWVLTILVTVLAVLQGLDVISMASAAPVYGVLQAIPFVFVVMTAVLMWRTVFHAKRKSDAYYPIKGILGKMLLCFALFWISSVAVSFVTSGFGSYLSLILEEIHETSFQTVMENVELKFSEALKAGASIGDVDFSVGFSQLNSATSSLTDSKLETLGIGVIFGLIVVLIILFVRGIQVLKAVAASRNSVEYGEKVGDAKITGKQMIAYGVVGVVVALLVYLLDPMLASMNFVSTGFNFIYESLASLTFGDGSKLTFMLLSEVPEYQVILAVPMVLIAMIGLVVFALFQAYRYVALSGTFAKINASTNTGLVPKLRLTALGVVGIVLSILMMSNGITWSCSFLFARVGGISVLTAIGKVVLIGVVILMFSMILLKNSNELQVCHETQCRELGKEIPAKKKEFSWTIGRAVLAIAACAVAWLGAHWLMSAMDSAASLVMQIFPVMGSYDLSSFGGSLMNEILYTLIQLSSQIMVLFSSVNQLVLRVGLIVAAVAWIISRNRFYKIGFSPEATQKASGGSLIAPKILLYVFAVISIILTVGQLFNEGAWAGELLTLIGSAFDMAILMGLSMFFLRKTKCGKVLKLLVPVAVGVCAELVYTLLFEMQDIWGSEVAIGVIVSIVVTTVVFQLVRWLFASTYYSETNNLFPIVFFDFLLTMMMSIVASNISGLAVSEEVSEFLPALMVELIRAIVEVFQQSGEEVLMTVLPLLINLAVIVIGLLAMLLIGVILLVRNLKANAIPGDDLCDLDHEDDEGEYVTEAEALAKQEAEAETVNA